jgi:hypothetical protein
MDPGTDEYSLRIIICTFLFLKTYDVNLSNPSNSLISSSDFSNNLVTVNKFNSFFLVVRHRGR